MTQAVVAPYWDNYFDELNIPRQKLGKHFVFYSKFSDINIYIIYFTFFIDVFHIKYDIHCKDKLCNLINMEVF